jgi:hypothetical protein
MKLIHQAIVAALLLLTLDHASSTASAQGTAFTYQGRLNDGGNPATGLYDFRFAIYDSSNVPGNIIAGPVTNSAVGVTNGLFTVSLDFGAGPFAGADRWLDIGARTNGGVFATLAPRQKLAPTPYAITAGNVSGTVAAGQLSGPVPLASLPTTILVTNGQTGVNLTGTFSGNGAGVTNVQLLNLNLGGAAAFTWPGNFTLASSPVVASGPGSVVAADVNGDGKVDLICANGVGFTLSVLTNNGSGGFALASSPFVDAEPSAVVAADINGDGKPDLICGSFNAHTLFVLTNNGSGGFTLASTPAVGNGAISLAVADVNGDGRLDLVSANSDDNTLSVLTNNGSGGFVPASTLAVGSDPTSVAAADVNGDGKVDLICANQRGNTLSVLTNNGSGGFALASLLAVGNSPASVVAMDVNGDGKPDLVCANYQDGTLSVLTNDGSGSFALASTQTVGSLPVFLEGADVNGDGKVDLICANLGGNTLSVLTNNGSGGFALASLLAVGNGPNSIAAADVNGDGHLDLICSDVYTNTLSVLFNQPILQILQGYFGGDGHGLINLNAANLTGAVPSSSLTSVPASSLTGSIADARLSTNVALLNASQTFTGANTFTNTQIFTGALLLNSSVGFDQSSAGSFLIDAPYIPGGRVTVLANGFVGIGVTSPTNRLQVAGIVGATAFVSTSDRNAKENFAPVSPAEVLDKVAALPITTWNFKELPGSRHMGPMAQDFYSAFHLGNSDTTITTVDPNGVALAAIQGLNLKLQADNAQLKQENELLAKRLDTLEAEVKAMAREKH